MKIGWCAPADLADTVAAAGCDYIELPLAEQGLEAPTFDAVRRGGELRGLPVPPLAFNYFFPRDMRIVGETIDQSRLDTWLARAADLMHRAGARVAVMGSAWARNVPDGFDRDRAERQIVDALRLAARRLCGTGVTLAIEPLYRVESNIINSVCEGAALARRVGRCEVRVLADFFHMDEEDEPLDTLLAHSGDVAHVHLADTGRRRPGSGTYPYDRFLELLQRSGYRGMMSAECKLDDPATEMRESVAFLRAKIAQTTNDRPVSTTRGGQS